MFVPEVCVGGFCLKGEDVGRFIESLETKYKKLEENLRSMEVALNKTLGEEKTVRERLDDIDEMRLENTRDIEDELRRVSITRRESLEKFKEKIESMEKERQKSAKLIDSLVQKKVS